MKQLIACTVAILLLTLKTKACSCTGKSKFIHSIGALTVEAEVIGSDSIFIQSNVVTIYFNNDSTNFIQDASTLHKGKYYVTLLQIRKLLHGVAVNDTLYLVNDYGYECFHTIPNHQIGQRYILSGNIDALPVVHSGDTTRQFNLFYLGSCLENIVLLRDGKVWGNVTRNKESRIEKQANLIRHISKRLSGSYYNLRFWNRKNKERFLQRMGERRFYRILKRRCKITLTD